MNYKKFFCIFVMNAFLGIFIIAGVVIYIDPLFHYHKPIPSYYYNLYNQRYQNNGILKNFEYDAIITGNSMSENFKVTEFNSLFDAKAIKVPYAGARYKEISDAINVAFKNGKKVKIVIAPLGNSGMMADKNDMRSDLGEYPEWLYNDYWYDDAKYILNKDILIKRCLPMLLNRFKGKNGGVTDFDRYSNWGRHNKDKYGKKYVLNNKKLLINKPRKTIHLSKDDEERVRENISQNIIDLAKNHPDTIFYYFCPPYSVAYYYDLVKYGKLERIFKAKEVSAKMMLEYPNIKLFSFNLMTDITTNLDNYKDLSHYGEWINSIILKNLREEKGILTKENYLEHLRKEREFYMNFRYEQL